MTTTALRPGSRLGTYPQRWDLGPDQFERWRQRLAQALSWRSYRRANVVAQVEQAALGLDQLDAAALTEQCDSIRYALMRDGLQARHVFRSFAVIAQFARRVTQMNYYDVQLFGAWVIVNGNMAEMATGEGKSFTATLAAATAALAGIPVHIVTTNEYLAQRDADEMEPLYQALGLSVAAVREDMSTAQKQAAYRSDIVYCSNQQVAFDYLHDRMVSRNQWGPLALKFSRAQREGQLVLRGLCFAIVDEADSVLVDEARTPLILSREHEDASQQQLVAQALALAGNMEEPTHFRCLPRERRIVVSAAGREWLAQQTQALTGIWCGQRHSEFLVHQALSAIHLFQRDIHYLVRDDSIEIIDRNTGRTMADRSWQRGLHQMIECKEKCKITGQRETLASISYQRFFRRYLHLGGMSGTLQQVAGEMRSVYQQRVFTVPTHRPGCRVDHGFYLHRRGHDKWLAVMQRIEAIHATGRPVLVGTASVHDSEFLGAFMARRGLACSVLNARQDQEEAQIVARAGQPGQITIATGIAGRGTDIELGPGVAELGGLHVISTECHEEYRVDRQLFGRCARQGDAGSCETHISLHDSLLRDYYSVRVRRLLGRLLDPDRPLRGWRARCLARLPQIRISQQYRTERRMVMESDDRLGKVLAYSGRQE